MRTHLGFSILLLSCLLLHPAPSTAATEAAYGVWWNEARTVQVEIGPCADGVCGNIVWLRDPLDSAGRPKVDHRNGDPALRTRPMLGLEVLSGLKPREGRPGVWSGGTAYDANRGKTYRCTVKMDGEDRAVVRGYIGISLFGRTEYWSRVDVPAVANVPAPVSLDFPNHDAAPLPNLSEPNSLP